MLEVYQGQGIKPREDLVDQRQVFGLLVFFEGFLGQVSNKGFRLYAFEALDSHRTYA